MSSGGTTGFFLLLLFFLCCRRCYCYFLCSIFGHEGDDGSDIAYINWLLMVRAGLLALEFYSPETQSWKQVLCVSIFTMCF